MKGVINLNFTILINCLKYCSTKIITVEQILNFLNCNKNGIAVEYNDSVLKQEYWGTTLLKQNSKLEIVTIVGGG